MAEPSSGVTVTWSVTSPSFLLQSLKSAVEKHKGEKMSQDKRLGDD